MPLYIGNDYKLETMKLNIVLYCKPEINKEKSDRMKEVLKKLHGEDVKFKSDEEDYVGGWVTVGYFSNYRNALSKIIGLEVEKSELKDVQTVMNRIDKAERDIVSALSEVSKLQLVESSKPDKIKEEVEAIVDSQ
jgi:hypothetical protein